MKHNWERVLRKLFAELLKFYIIQNTNLQNNCWKKWDCSFFGFILYMI